MSVLNRLGVGTSGYSEATDPTSGAALKLQGVQKVYERGSPVHALSDVSCAIAAGSYTAIMGPSGSGKTTLMNLLGALDSPSAGEILFDGEDIGTMAESDRVDLRGREIGFVFQTFNLMPRLTALENVALPLVFADQPKAQRQQRAQELLEQVGLGDRADHLPSELSGGQRQRVAIARALVRDPGLILADEPTGNLDTKTGEQILDVLDGLRETGTTVVLVTHQRSVANRADRIVHVMDGELTHIEEMVQTTWF